MATTTEEIETRRSVSSQQVIGVLLGLVVLLGLMWFFFLRGTPSEEVVATPPVTTPTTEPEPEETTAPGDTKKGPLQTFQVFAPKDPFKPLIAESSGTTGSVAAPTDTSGDTSGDTGTDPGTAPSGGSDISGDGSGSGGGSQNVGGRRVRLIDTFRAGGELRARIQVDGTVYTVGEGDRFAENFEVVSISGSCASILYGDDQFSLCEGEEILK